LPSSSANDSGANDSQRQLFAGSAGLFIPKSVLVASLLKDIVSDFSYMAGDP